MGLVLRLKTILIIFGCLGYTVGHAVFKTYIPNGEGVLNPFCKCGVGHQKRYSTYSTWERVGHLFPNGEYSHALNPFGMDFKLNGFVSNHLFRILIGFYIRRFLGTHLRIIKPFLMKGLLLISILKCNIYQYALVQVGINSIGIKERCIVHCIINSYTRHIHIYYVIRRLI